MQLEPKSHRPASRNLSRAVSHLTLVGEQLIAASKASADAYQRNRFHNLALGLREFSLPLSRIASLLERGGDQ